MEMMDLGGTNVETTRESPSLPHELVADILSRLPAVHLWPLRFVSKPWYQLIARDPSFAESVFDKSDSPPTSIIAWGEKQNSTSTSTSTSSNNDEKLELYLVPHHTECDLAVKLNLPFLAPGDQQDVSCCPIYGICNGMLCLSHVDKHEVYIWNPLTNHHITIPYHPTPLKSSDHRMVTLFAFAYLQTANHYKLIRLDSELNWGELEYHTQISVYTLGGVDSGSDSSWRIVTKDMPYGVTFSGVPCPQVNGLVHWLARKEGEWPISVIIAFDLKDELLYEIEPPINMRAYGFRSDMACVQELGGLLCLFNANNKVGVDVWAMKVNGGSFTWTKHFKIGTPEIVGDFSLLIPLGVVAHSGDVILVKNTKGLIAYNSNTKSVIHLKEFGFAIANAHAYSGSIISPRAISGAGHIGT